MNKTVKITKHFVIRDDLNIDASKKILKVNSVTSQSVSSLINLNGLLFINKYYDKEVELIFFNQLEQEIQVEILKCSSEDDAVFVKRMLDDYFFNKQVIKVNDKYKTEESAVIEDGTLYGNKNTPIDLLNVIKVKLSGNILMCHLKDGRALMYHESSTENIEEVHLMVKDYLKKLRTVAIFKDLQKNNPMLSPKAAWANAEETYELLDVQGIGVGY